jgi:hypothetical protein
MVVPFTAGSATDILGADRRPEAVGAAGSARGHRQPARRGRHDRRSDRREVAGDGYTLLVHSAAHAYNPAIYCEPDLRHGQGLRRGRAARRAAECAGRRSPRQASRPVADLIAGGQAKAGALNFASAGNGSGTHINGEKFKLAAGIDVLHIPYKGTPEALTDTMAGRVTYFFSPISAGAAAGARRQAHRAWREHREAVERAAERADDRRIGPPGFDYNLWVGVFAPAGTPGDLVDKINRDVLGALATPEVKERLAALGADADADDARRIPEIRAAGNRRVGQGDQGRRDRGQ